MKNILIASIKIFHFSNMTHRKNYLKISDPKINKLFTWVYAALFAIAALVFAIIIAELVSFYFAEDGFELSSVIPCVIPFVNTLFGVFIILFIVFLTIVIYNYIINKENEKEEQIIYEFKSPLIGAAKDHEQEIVEMLKSIALPAPNKKTINHAKTAKFIHALIALDLINKNMVGGRRFMAWISLETKYSVGEPRVFNQALKLVKINDPEVKRYQEQLAQIIAK